MQWTINSENSVFLSILLYSGKMCAKQPNNKCNGLLIVKIAFSYLYYYIAEKCVQKSLIINAVDY